MYGSGSLFWNSRLRPVKRMTIADIHRNSKKSITETSSERKLTVRCKKGSPKRFQLLYDFQLNQTRLFSLFFRLASSLAELGSRSRICRSFNHGIREVLFFSKPRGLIISRCLARFHTIIYTLWPFSTHEYFRETLWPLSLENTMAIFTAISGQILFYSSVSWYYCQWKPIT